MEVRKRIVVRAILLGIFFTILFFLLGIRVYWIQVVDAKWLNARAQKMWESEAFVEPKRGSILDRNGQPLAYSGPSYNVVAILSKKDPNRVTNPVEVSQKLAPILGMDPNDILKQLNREDRYQVEFWPEGWKISQEKADEIQALKLNGIHLQKNTKRYYPNQKFAAHTLGYVDKEGIARMGLEFLYNKELSGTEGKYRFIKDGKNVVLPAGVEDYVPAKDGYDLYLTIDQRIQHFVEKALDEAQETFQPKKMTVVVADPNTMEILAMANYPDFDPNNYSEITNYTNFATSSMFEPGSTFKIVTLAAAIEQGVFNPEEKYKSGRYTDENIRIPIRDHNEGKGWGEITFLEGFQRSSNVAFVHLGNRLGKETLFDYFNRFGFGAPTGIDLPNEAKGKLPDPNRAYPRDIAVTTFGQGVSVTAIQQIAAISAIANGGKLLKPYLVKKIVDSKTGEVIKEIEPTVVRQPIKPETAKRTNEILETVVTSEVGTGRGYAIEGYRIAGKTGTAQKIGEDGKYEEDKFIYSFIGYAPVEDPKLIIYVVVEEPNRRVEASSIVVGPMFKSIMKNSLNYLQVQPEQKVVQKVSVSEEIKVPNVMNEHTKTAKQTLINLGLKPLVIGEGEKITRQYPEGDAITDSNATVYLLTNVNEIVMPDFIGKSMRDAIEFSTFIGIPIQVNGTGYIVKQSIAPGTNIKEGDVLSLYLEPLNPLRSDGSNYLESETRIENEQASDQEENTNVEQDSHIETEEIIDQETDAESSIAPMQVGGME